MSENEQPSVTKILFDTSKYHCVFTFTTSDDDEDCVIKVPIEAIEEDEVIHCIAGAIAINLGLLEELINNFKKKGQLVEEAKHTPEEIEPANPFPPDPNQ